MVRNKQFLDYSNFPNFLTILTIASNDEVHDNECLRYVYAQISHHTNANMNVGEKWNAFQLWSWE